LSTQEWPPDVNAGEQNPITLPQERILHLLSEGEIEVEGLIPWSSNATLLVTVRDDELSTLAVYKPQHGERPLWDFSYGTLGIREVAAFLIDDALSWGLVPPTVLRQGPHGLGSVQLFVEAQEDTHFFTIQENETYAADLKRLAAFDVVVNNADRKSGHCLVDQSGHLWAIDNALTFHAEPKLRTVIWDFADQPLPADVLAGLTVLYDELGKGTSLRKAMDHLLNKSEIAALRHRLQRLIQAGCFPEPGPGRPVPWPLI
jgi:uncharacterized repeat protein (TIGR03843 family)